MGASCSEKCAALNVTIPFLVTKLPSVTNTRSLPQKTTLDNGHYVRTAAQHKILFFIYHFNDFSTCWHGAAMCPCPHAGHPFLCGPCSAERTEHA